MKLTSSSPLARASWRKPTCSNTSDAPLRPRRGGRGDGVGRVGDLRAWRVTFSISSMSMKDWRISR
jgi:hypothetical protein